ncbi:ABC transporter substrate-binding protein [Phytohabitans sp. ZYX-F-186]|uniref:ABC transporter substrate-binding protein n=1 Tax=Phytohabitans maris TaxID=3071409 RepID=A0ABU0ZN24_9ACTN|nr:ABC transporter substrate-binding protein [Phytohabitans sp. ZYX-F-186]MDQ7908061.1 ABC transporter substrate-binding protein [Phytohabitans sp. ZYX-F-186]
MRGRRRWRAVLACAALLVSLAACGGGGESGAGADGDPTVPVGGTLRVALGQPEADLNGLQYKTHSFNVLDQIYEPLVRYGPKGEIQPGLAERWEVSPDGLTLTFHLRAGVTFSDGVAFTAPVAKTDMERWIGDTPFLGISRQTKAIEAPDERTLVLRLKGAYYPALQELTLMRPVRFRSPASFDAAGNFVKPIGTGPYELESSSQTEIVLVRNDTYWGGRPSLDRVVFAVMPDSQARLAALKAGEVDVIGGDYLAPLAPEETLDLRQQSGVTLLTEPSSTNLLLAFNTTTGNRALADPRVREAVNRALDRDAYAKALFHDLAKPATQVFPPSIPYAPPEPRDVSLDQTKAKDLLAQAGASTLSLRLILDPGMLPQARTLSEAIQADLAKVGIQVEIDQLDSAGYSDTAAKRDYDLLFYLTYGPPYDPFAMLNANFRSTEPTFLYSAPGLDELVDTALAGTTDAARAAAYDKVWARLNGDWAVAPVVELPRVWAVGPAVKGFTLGVTEYDLPLAKVGVAR